MSEKRTLLQKILLGLLAAMTVLFAVLTGVNRSQPLVQWGGSLLRPLNTFPTLLDALGRIGLELRR